MVKNRNKNRKELDRNESIELDLNYNEFRLMNCSSGDVSSSTSSGSSGGVSSHNSSGHNSHNSTSHNTSTTSTSHNTSTTSHSSHKKSKIKKTLQENRMKIIRNSKIISILKSMEKKELERVKVDQSIDNLHLLLEGL